MILSFKLKDENIKLIPQPNGETIVNFELESNQNILVFKIKKYNYESERALSVTFDVKNNKINAGTI